VQIAIGISVHRGHPPIHRSARLNNSKATTVVHVIPKPRVAERWVQTDGCPTGIPEPQGRRGGNCECECHEYSGRLSSHSLARNHSDERPHRTLYLVSIANPQLLTDYIRMSRNQPPAKGE